MLKYTNVSRLRPYWPLAASALFRKSMKLSTVIKLSAPSKLPTRVAGPTSNQRYWSERVGFRRAELKLMRR